MGSPPLLPPAWSVTLCLRCRRGLEIRAAAENVLPGWGHGGERLSFLLRLRRRLRLRLAVSSRCGPRAPAPATEPKDPRAGKVLRLLRRMWARAPRVRPPIWWPRKKPTGRAAARSGSHSRSQSQNRAAMRPAQCNRAWPAKARTAMLVAAVVAVAAASIAALRLTDGFRCTSWRCFLAKRFLQFLGAPPLREWLPNGMASLNWLPTKWRL